MARRSSSYRPDRPVVAELASGGIVVQRSTGEVLLLHETEEDRWTLPKGHVEAGETLRQAADREVREETGLTKVDLGDELGQVTYRFYDPRRDLNVLKVVVYFRASTGERTLRLESIFDRAEWVKLPEARVRVGTSSDRTALGWIGP